MDLQFLDLALQDVRVYRNLVIAGEVEVLELRLLQNFEGGLACNIRIH